MGARNYLLVLTTHPSRAGAERLAKVLVKERLIACAQIGPAVVSQYRWKGRVEKTKEIQLWMKTEKRLFDPLSQKISALHPFEVPEIIAIPMVAANRAYLRWVSDEVRSSEKK